MNFGISYQGSKSKIANDLISRLPSGKRFVDLFGGGFAMSHCALLSHKYEQVLYNDIETLLIDLIKDAIHGKYSYDVFKPPFITRKEFMEKKETDGYVKFIWSFSNGGKAYLFGEDIEEQKKSIHNWVVFGIKDNFMETYFPDVDKYIKTKDIKKRRLLFRTYVEKNKVKIKSRFQQLERLERLDTLKSLQQLEQLERLDTLKQPKLLFSNISYDQYIYIYGDIVYCDIPYENTATYTKSECFDYEKFYDWAYTRDYPVFFSSYEISDKRFTKVYAMGKRNLMNGRRITKYNYECLYANAKGVEIYGKK